MRRWLLDAPRLALFSLGLIVAGIAVSGYLTIVHFRPALLACAVGGCETAQTSRYAELGGVPIAALGLGMYGVLAALGLLRLARPARAPDLTMALFALTLAGALYTAYLTYVELAVIDAICQWCVLFALVTWALLVTEGAQVAADIAQPHEDTRW